MALLYCIGKSSYLSRGVLLKHQDESSRMLISLAWSGAKQASKPIAVRWRGNEMIDSAPRMDVAVGGGNTGCISVQWGSNVVLFAITIITIEGGTGRGGW